MKIGLAQLRSGTNWSANIDAVAEYAVQAKQAGASILFTPEATNLVERDARLQKSALSGGAGETSVRAAAAVASRNSLWLVAGSFILPTEDGRAVNRSIVFDPKGKITATYDKIHLFDANLGAGEIYRESEAVQRGQSAVMTSLAGTLVGLSICYDLRFPALYKRYAQAGAMIITAPAAFTRQTGEAHWETLLRARAIESGAYIVAPAQGGLHEDGRETWGRSMVIDPWGGVVAKKDDAEPGLLLADLDFGAVQTARRRMPAWSVDTAFDGP